ncbi:T9SS type A sorting domain-containing protein [Chryseobacterium camelliae]|uniref:T9SS type A sorting domain-containing protein n=1 Tax=Chryseobacterium camelliae TaxID=1265445 RepID=A0ABY7QRI0_9FLAO|nr:T9SS type A sorting domain-containing protein [Chryseobacterium camelliae]WBV61944.1 T9SS type A sorting domain-containing protein [Chryseobacterium camelliae]
MKYKFIFSLFCIISFSNIFSSQAPATQWQKNYGGTLPETLPDIALTSDGGYILAGNSRSNNGDVTGNHGANDFWVVKTNSTGNILWQKSLGGSGVDIATSVRQTSDGGYIVAGYTMSTDGDVMGNHGGNDVWIVKLDVSGNLQWQKTFGGSNDEAAQSIRQTTDGGYIVAGWTNSINGNITTNHGSRDYWVLKLDATGNLQWQKTYGGGDWDSANSIEQTTDGGYIIGGYSGSLNNDVTGNHGSSDYWIVKISATGALQWQKSLGGSAVDQAYSVKQTSDGGYIAFGQSKSTDGDVTGSHGNDDYWLVKLSSTGNLQWQKTYGGSLYDRGTDVSQTSDGGYIMTGVSFPINLEGGTTGIGANDYLIVKTDALGAIEWQQTYGGLSDDYGTSVKQTPDGGYILCGYSNAITGSSGNYDYWIIKLTGNQLSTHENSVKNNISIYPNPAKDFITVDHLPGETTISINDMSGRRIFSKKYAEAKVSMNTSQLTNGTYIIQVDDQEKTILSEKLIIKK